MAKKKPPQPKQAPKAKSPVTKAKAKLPPTQPRTRRGTFDKKKAEQSGPKVNAWNKRKAEQDKIVKAVKHPRIIMFGGKDTGKTTVLEDAARFGGMETDKFIFNKLKPLRIIDCGNAAETIAMKSFYDEYKRGDIIIMRATLHHTKTNPDGTPLILTEPTEIIANIRDLIVMCEKEIDGSIGIDEFDKIEEWCRIYIYRNHGIYEKKDGELWYKKKIKMIKGKEVVEPERQVIRLPRWMYGPRNTQIKKIIGKLTHINMPVILVAHEEEEYNKLNDQPTGKIIPNLRPFVSNFADLIIRFENFESEVVQNKKGKISIGLEDNRRMISSKNRLQKGKKPERIVVEQESFEFSDVFSILKGEIDGKEKTTKKEHKKEHKKDSTKKDSKKTSGKKVSSKKASPKKR